MLSPRIYSRHPTWPPTVQLLPNSAANKSYKPCSLLKSEHRYTTSLPEITPDEDPFSHFLSPVLEEETLAEVNYAAGITPYIFDPASRRDALFRARLEEKWETFVARRLLQHDTYGMSMPAPLPPPFPQCSFPEEDAIPELLEEAVDSVPTTPDDGPGSPSQTQWYFPDTIDVEDMDYSGDELVDGWEADRRRISGGPKRSMCIRSRQPSRRTLSGKKHAWREPSPNLWTVNEEAEEDMDEGKRGRKGRKRAKTVHWNEAVEVLEFER